MTVGTLSESLKTIFAVAFALALFQTSTLIIGGLIAKDALDWFYTMFPHWWQRMLVVIIPLSGIGNLFAAYAFQSPLLAGSVFLVLGMWAPVIASWFVAGARPDGDVLLIMVCITLLGVLLGIRMSDMS